MLRTEQILDEFRIDTAQSIRELNVSGRKLVEIACLDSFTNLLYLNIANNQIRSLDFAQGLQLRVLIADSNQITSLQPLRRQKQLERISVNQNPIDSSGIISLGPLKSLKHLFIYNTPAVSQPECYGVLVMTFPNLEYLNEEKVRSPGGDLVDLEHFVQSLPCSERLEKLPQKAWVEPEQFVLPGLLGFDRICLEIEQSLRESKQ